MTVTELHNGKIAAGECLAAIREHGGFVLRVPDTVANCWRLRMWNGASVPTELKFRLLELQPFVFVLLRELVGKDEQ